MSFQAYLDSVRAKTGKTPEDFAKLATQKGLAKHGDIVKWLKADFELGHGHATAIAGVLMKQGAPKATTEDKFGALFSGKKQRWRKPCDHLIEEIRKFGSDFHANPGGTYINLLRDGKKLAILQPSSADRLDIGIKLKGVPAEGRFELAGSWNAMVTHRLRIGDPAEIDREVITWLRAGLRRCRMMSVAARASDYGEVNPARHRAGRATRSVCPLGNLRECLKSKLAAPESRWTQPRGSSLPATELTTRAYVKLA